MLIARFSKHIQEDIQRNWSSWNFGEEGLKCDEEQLEAWKEEAINENIPLCISGFELWGNEIEEADIRELYPNYWVLVDNTNGFGDGLFGTPLKSSRLEDAIKEAEKADYSGEGIKFNASEAKLLLSIENSTIHIFEIKE